jgi:ribosomal protein S17E
MLAGRLPSYLKETIEKYHDRWLRKFRLNDAYVEELRQRDYKVHIY